MKQYVNYRKEEVHMLHITAQGLSEEEEMALRKMVRKMARKRKHENRPRIFYNLMFCSKAGPGLYIQTGQSNM